MRKLNKAHTRGSVISNKYEQGNDVMDETGRKWRERGCFRRRKQPKVTTSSASGPGRSGATRVLGVRTREGWCWRTVTWHVRASTGRTSERVARPHDGGMEEADRHADRHLASPHQHRKDERPCGSSAQGRDKGGEKGWHGGYVAAVARGRDR